MAINGLFIILGFQGIVINKAALFNLTRRKKVKVGKMYCKGYLDS